MKTRLTMIAMLMMAMAASMSAQFRSDVYVPLEEGEYRVSFNLASVSQTLGVDAEEYNAVMSEWLNVVRDKKSPYENQKLLYLVPAEGEKTVGGNHAYFDLTADGKMSQEMSAPWMCQVGIEPGQNRLNFMFTLGRDIFTDQWLLKEGNVCHAVFAAEFGGKVATFDISLHVQAGRLGQEVALTTLEKVGEQTVKMQYKAGKKCEQKLDLEAIASLFGGNVKGGNLELYTFADANGAMLTDGHAYEEVAMTTLNENCVEVTGAKKTFRLGYYPMPQAIEVTPVDGFAAGEHATGALLLVADGKYYEVKLDVQFGDSQQEAKNMAVVAGAVECGKFARSLTVRPDNYDPATASFGIPVLAKALGVESSELKAALAAWARGEQMADGSEMVYNLSDHASTSYVAGSGNFCMQRNGRVEKKGEGEWACVMEVDGVLDELHYGLYQTEGALKNGDACNVQLGIYYKGRMATLDLTLNVADNAAGETVALADLKKVGEEVLTGKYDYVKGLRFRLSLDEMAKKFSGTVTGKNLKLYVLTDAEKGLLTDRYSYDLAPTAVLDVEVKEVTDFQSFDCFTLTYSPYQELMVVGVSPDAFKGGQRTSGSVFLVAEGQYVELPLDIEFGNVPTDVQNLDIVGTENVDVKLMVTGDYYTYLDNESGDMALISTAINAQRVAELLGTESPILYAEELDGNDVKLTSRYNASPGQGFWFDTVNGKAYRCAATETGRLGVYYADGEFKWYEMPEGVTVGEKCDVTLYLANTESGKAVKCVMSVEFVNEVGAPNVYYVRRLPLGYGRTTGIAETQTDTQTPTRAIYDLSGRRVQKPTKGIYIRDGKKVLY